MSYCNKAHFCIHIESTAPTDGMYELIPEFKIEQRESNLNLTEIVEGPDQCSEPKTNFAQEGQAPVHLIPIVFAYIQSML